MNENPANHDADADAPEAFTHADTLEMGSTSPRSRTSRCCAA